MPVLDNPPRSYCEGVQLICPALTYEHVCAVSGRRFKYLLYVDFMGNLADDVCQNALRHLEEVTEFMRVLGCYPARKLEGSSAG